MEGRNIEKYENEHINGLFDFIDKSPASFHAVENAADMLHGFTRLFEDEPWKIEKNKKYIVIHDGAALLAFSTGDGGVKNGIRMIGAHGDSPGFKIKPRCEMLSSNKYIKLNTEVYGGPIYSSWFDRPLGIAGRICHKGESAFKPRETLVNIARPVLVIPNCAIHLNRDVNKGYEYNAQKDVLPLLGLVEGELEKDGYFLDMLAGECGIPADDILNFDLSLYELGKCALFGAKNEFISAPRLDDLWMVYAGLSGLLESADNGRFKALLIVDNEETGSKTSSGAASAFLRDTLKRIFLSMGKTEEEFMIAIRKSVIISADLAHAEHPNYEDKADPTVKTVLGGGPAVKFSAMNRNATDGFSSSVFAAICEKAGVPHQSYSCRSDISGGSTIGPIVSSKLSARVVDVGAPVLGMHACREVAAVCDNSSAIKAFAAFYEVE